MVNWLHTQTDKGIRGCMVLIQEKIKSNMVDVSQYSHWLACNMCVEGEQIMLYNVYAPKFKSERRIVWNELCDLDLAFFLGIGILRKENVSHEWNCVI